MLIRPLLALAFVLALVHPAAAATHTVRNTDAEGEGSLLEAVDAAKAGDTILFGGGVRGTIALDEPLDIDGLNLKGPGADVVTVRGSGEAVLRLEGTVSISGLTFAGGDTAIAISGGKTTLLECAVRDSRGAGITIESGQLTLARSQVSGNAGAGVESSGGNVVCANSTVAENGGAGLRGDGSLTLASCTIANNRGTGIEAGAGGAAARNTLLAGNLRACKGTVTSDGYNLTDDESCAFHATGDVANDDTRVAALAANGGPTETVALTGGSPAVDAGDPAGCVDSTGALLTVDQRGMRRPAGGRCDIGAYEQPVAVTGTVVNRIVALVDGDPITLHEVSTFTASDPRLAEAARTGDQAGVLDLLITQRILAKEIQAQGITISDAEIDRYVASIRQRNNLSEEQLGAALAQQGLTMERYRAQIKEELERAQLINREIRGKVSVSPEEIERYRKAQGEEDSDHADEQVSISDIVLRIPPDASPAQVEAIEARADTIYAELENGADFAEVAKKESEDGAAASGGKLGTFKKGEMREELEEAVADLEPGEYSRPIKSADAIHIVRLDERLGAGSEGPPLSDSAREEIKEKLYSQALEERYARWLKEDLRQKHSVEMVP